jgi:hypothetical protein
MLDVARCQHRREFVEHHEPGGVDSLIAEVRMLAGHAFSPAGQSFGFDFYQEDAAVGCRAETGLERLDEGYAKFAEKNSVNLHKRFRVSMAGSAGADPTVPSYGSCQGPRLYMPLPLVSLRKRSTANPRANAD